ncbi:hypothetical protein [Streptomyces sp. NPDC058373]|uniref:hypothetical protein n=1 Tax=Streptomyces sp. NPDC058373 TaxID=3346465 RepID=UPI003660A75E
MGGAGALREFVPLRRRAPRLPRPSRSSAPRLRLRRDESSPGDRGGRRTAGRPTSPLVQRWLERLLTPLAAALLEADSAREGIHGAVRAYLGFVRAHPDAARLLHSATADRHGMAHAQELRDAQEARLSPLAAWLQHHVATGELAQLSPSLLESLILGPVVAIARRHLTLGDTDLDEAARELPERIWGSVRG